MTAQYLLRFDDLTERMNWSVWDRIENALRRLAIRPIVAVVPANEDPSLVVGPAREDFWDRVRSWQAAGWAIGLHGHQHVYSTDDAGLVGLRPKSEFAGLPRDLQATKLDEALQIFSAQGVHPDVWVAPGHTFDETTVEILVGRGIGTISDGWGRRPYARFGAVWLPQQLWEYRTRRSGLWTVCVHHNSWDATQTAAFIASVERYADRTTSVDEVKHRWLAKPYGLADRVHGAVQRNVITARAHVSRVVRR